MIAVLLFFGCAQLIAQQPYPSAGAPQYGSSNGQYGGQYAPPPAPPNGYAQTQQYPPPNDPEPRNPQSSYPQYAPPQGQQPQDQQPRYAQPAYPDQPQPYPDQAQPYPQQPGAEPGGQQAYGQESPVAQPLSADQLEQLVAPIALYPDALLAQILAASTYPAQVAVADQWAHQMQTQGYGSPDQIAAGADSQNWDSSVKALTAFPQVLDSMNQNLEWTTNLGNAYFNQPQDVMQTVQVMRQRAEEAGNLQDTPQESVTDDQGAIELAPPDPQMVYVPAYNPWYVYGAPLAPYPGFSLLGALGGFWGASPIRFGLGIALAAFERFPWNWLDWGMGWRSHAVLFNRGNYFTHSRSVADWGFAHGGPRAYGDWARSGRYGNNGYRGAQAYGRSGNSYFRGSGQSAMRPAEPWGRSAQSLSRPVQQTYNRGPQSFSRPQGDAYRSQPYAGRPEYSGRSGYGYVNRPSGNYGTRPSAGYGDSYRSSRSSGFGNQRAFAAPASRAFANPGRSSGFRDYGQARGGYGISGGRAPRGYSGGGRAPRGFGQMSAPKMGHSGGHGGFGGGHGGHGGGHGGHGGGGHGGGGHHR